MPKIPTGEKSIWANWLWLLRSGDNLPGIAYQWSPVSNASAWAAEIKIPVPKSETCGISDSNILKLIVTLRDSFEHGLCNLCFCTDAARQVPCDLNFVGDVG